MYRSQIKRLLDIILSVLGLLILSPLFIIISILIYLNLGKPIIFRQPRPGYKEKLFFLLKFRTMTDERDEQGILLPDNIRLTKFGKALRASSLDELPELINILKNEMSIVGPRPLLVRDMVFMSPKQRKRHDAYPGLTGLAQISGRNSISWEEKLTLDLHYVEKISFMIDMKIIFTTILKVFQREGISEEGMETAQDLCDYLLNNGKIDDQKYKLLNIEAEKIIKEIV